MRLTVLLDVEDTGLAEFLTRNLSNVFNAEVKLDYVKLENVAEAFHAKRLQFNAAILLEKIQVGDDYVLLVTDKDLYVPGLNFVFGYAPGRKGVVSTFRLDPSRYGDFFDRGLYLSRILKEAVHEIGHMLGLGHCRKAGCVMNFSNSVYDVDRKRERFCAKCLARLSTLMS